MNINVQVVLKKEEEKYKDSLLVYLFPISCQLEGYSSCRV